MSEPWDEDEVVATKAWDHSLFKRLLRFATPHKQLFLRCFMVLMGLFAGLARGFFGSLGIVFAGFRILLAQGLFRGGVWWRVRG